MMHPKSMGHNDWAYVLRVVLAPYLLDKEGNWNVPYADNIIYDWAKVLIDYYRHNPVPR